MLNRGLLFSLSKSDVLFKSPVISKSIEMQELSVLILFIVTDLDKSIYVDILYLSWSSVTLKLSSAFLIVAAKSSGLYHSSFSN